MDLARRGVVHMSSLSCEVDTGVSGSLGALSEAVVGGGAAVVMSLFFIVFITGHSTGHHGDVHPVPPHSVQCCRQLNVDFLAQRAW